MKQQNIDDDDTVSPSPKPADEIARFDSLKTLRAENMRRAKLTGQHGTRSARSSEFGDNKS
jgi:hypothetical protein